jgi:ABC-type transporter Mla MlaB component
LGQTTDILLGDSILANAMELTDSASSPAIEEAAILYANGQPLPAVAVLSDAVKGDSTGPASTQAWLMLFELYQVLGKRADFENLAIDYAIRFEASAPAWSESVEPIAAPAPAMAAAPQSTGVTFKGPLSTAIVTQLDQLKRLAQKNPVLHLDFSQVTEVESAGADLILRVFAAFQKSNHEVIIEGAEHLVDRLMASVEVGRRDPSNATWMLLLEVYRVLDRQAAFEETSIDYCVTYEVSPPSWEPPSSKFRLGNVKQVVETPVVQLQEITELPLDTVSLSGDLLGKADSDLQRLGNFAAEHRKVLVDCSRLRRVDFTAAGVLLNWAVGAQSSSKSIEFREVSNLVAALFAVMGLHEVATIERRRV